MDGFQNQGWKSQKKKNKRNLEECTQEQPAPST